MSAEDLGRRELGQIREQRLDELLTTIRLLQTPTANQRLNIPAIDALLTTTPKSRIDPTTLSSIPNPPIIEITSTTPKSGKTQLLYYIIASLLLQDILSVTTATTEEGGQAATIALLTTPSNPLSISRLSTICLSLLQNSNPCISIPTAQQIILKALDHLHIFTPTSLPSLLSTISSLPSYFLSPINGSKDRRMGSVIVDSITEFYWHDRVASTQTQQGQGLQGLQGSRYPALASKLKSVGMALQTPILYTTADFSTASSAFSVNKTANTAAAATATTTTTITATVISKSRLPNPWPTLPSLRLIATKSPTQEPIPSNNSKDIKTLVSESKRLWKEVEEKGKGVEIDVFVVGATPVPAPAPGSGTGTGSELHEYPEVDGDGDGNGGGNEGGDGHGDGDGGEGRRARRMGFRMLVSDKGITML